MIDISIEEFEKLKKAKILLDKIILDFDPENGMINSINTINELMNYKYE
ncbi:MAG: hypothetical protein M0R17_02720 [Candidatus Omnitrophica bacterium]|jgi:hypothetical protein|nr:hypothetical protein [Candidatus Omnitrophota bacterium]